MLLESESASLIQTPILGERPFPAVPFSELGAKDAHVEGNLQAGCRSKPERIEWNRPLRTIPVLFPRVLSRSLQRIAAPCRVVR